MPISGLVIQVEPAQRSAVIEELSAIEALELPEIPAGEKLVAVIDVSTLAEEDALFKQINELPGVQNVTLSCHNFEDLDEPQAS